MDKDLSLRASSFYLSESFLQPQLFFYSFHKKIDS